MDEYEFQRERMRTWQYAATAALFGGKTYDAAIRAADHVQEAYEKRFPVVERKD